MTIVMNMSGYEIEREETTVDEYGNEVLYAEWVPQLAQIEDSHVDEKNRRDIFPGELVNVDVDAFLEKMYKYQR